MPRTDDAGYEEQERLLDPHRREEEERARREAIDRLAERGVSTLDSDADEDLADLLDALERFEAAVERRGGDLMVNRIGSSEPDDPAFVPPRRGESEPIASYRTRVEAALARLRSRS